MKTANVAVAKNELSSLLRRVKRGETVVITERNQPVARLQPFVSLAGTDAVPAALYEAGILHAPAGRKLDAAAFLRSGRPALARGRTLTEAVLAERAEGR
jgi:prevent-host-death family protein